MNHSYKNCVWVITSVAIIAADVMFSYGQTTAFGVRVTPSYVPGAAVENPSASNIYGSPDLNLNIGIYALKYFKSGPVGIKAGLEHGAVPFILGVDAPRSSFGTGAGGDRQVHVTYQASDLGYVALTVSPTYKLPLKHRSLEFSVGPSVRFYNYPHNGFSELGLAFNRSTPYDPDDPAAGPPDVRARVVNLDHLYVSVPISVDYVIRAGIRSQVKFGIMHNISRPLKGELDVMMNGEMFYGSFNPRTNFWGVNVQYERLPKKIAQSYKKPTPLVDQPSTYKKSIFLETYTKPGFLTANYDMRLKKDSYSGAGFSVGAGIGGDYFTDVTNNNKSTKRRMLAIPIGFNYALGEKRHGAELGVGITPQVALENVRDQNPSNYLGFNLRVGYRYQPDIKGFTTKIAWIPTMKKTVTPDYRLTLFNAGIAVGYSF